MEGRRGGGEERWRRGEVEEKRGGGEMEGLWRRGGHECVGWLEVVYYGIFSYRASWPILLVEAKFESM